MRLVLQKGVPLDLRHACRAAPGAHVASGSDVRSAPRPVSARANRLHVQHGQIRASRKAYGMICRAAAGEPGPAPARFVVRSWAVAFGEHLRIVGSSDALGGWDPVGGLALEWAEGDDWYGEATLAPGACGFKVVRMHEDVVVEWEAAEDRHVAVPEAAGGGVQIVCDGAATALEVAPAVTPEAAEVVELVAQRISGLREKAAEEEESAPEPAPETPAEPVAAAEAAADAGADESPEVAESPPPAALEYEQPPPDGAEEAPDADAPEAALPEEEPTGEGAAALEEAPAAAAAPRPEDALGGAPPPAKAETLSPKADALSPKADALSPKAQDAADGSVTYTFAAEDKSIQEKAARFLEDIKARLYGTK